MNILLWIIFGAIAGWIGSLIAGTDASQGLIQNIIVGVIGAFVGGLIFNFFGETGVTGFNFYSLLVAVVGSTIFIGVAQALSRN